MSLTDIYLPEIDSKIDRWKLGCEEYSHFLRSLDEEEYEYLMNPPENIGDIQAFFLGEKPVYAFDCNVESIWEKLKHCGYPAAGYFLYNLEKVKDVMQRYTDIFSSLGWNTQDDCIRGIDAIGDNSIPHTYRIAVGLLLGYPYSACVLHAKNEISFKDVNIRIQKIWNRELGSNERKKRLERIQECEKQGKNPLYTILLEDLESNPEALGISPEEQNSLYEAAREQGKMKKFNAYGFVWSDNGKSPESAGEELRLKGILEESGILNIRRATPHISRDTIWSKFYSLLKR